MSMIKAKIVECQTHVLLEPSTTTYIRPRLRHRSYYGEKPNLNLSNAKVAYISFVGKNARIKKCLFYCAWTFRIHVTPIRSQAAHQWECNLVGIFH
jgi:hypothetical protein